MELAGQKSVIERRHVRLSSVLVVSTASWDKFWSFVCVRSLKLLLSLVMLLSSLALPRSKSDLRFDHISGGNAIRHDEQVDRNSRGGCSLSHVRTAHPQHTSSGDNVEEARGEDCLGYNSAAISV